MPSFWIKVAGYPAQVTVRADTGFMSAEAEADATAGVSEAPPRSPMPLQTATNSI